MAVYRDSAGFAQETPPQSGGSSAPAQLINDDLDTDGNHVPTHKAHAYTYDASGNLYTDTVRDGSRAWVRTFQWAGGNQVGDSGWIKQ